MQIIIISSERLFREGLAALLDGRANVMLSASIREGVRGRLGRDTVVIVDLRFVVERDIDYLVGAQEFGSFQVLFIADVEQKVPGGVEAVLSRNDSGADLLRNVLENAIQPEPLEVASPVRSRIVTHASNKRGRPRVITNSLPLSLRQYQAAQLAAQGYSNPKIAKIMNIQEQTVKNVIGTVLKRLDCTGRGELADKLGAS